MAVDRNLDEFAADYVAGNLSATEAEVFARLLVEQPKLQQTVRQLEASVELMIGEMPLLDPPQQLEAAILERADALAHADASARIDSSLPTEIKPSLRQRGLPRFLVSGLGVLATGAALVALAMGLSNQRLRLANQQLRQDLRTANQALLAADQAVLAANDAQEAQMILHQQSTRFYDFEGTPAAQTAFGNMVVDTDGLRAAIAFQNLPPGQTYALWVVRDGDYIFCGSFEADATGEAFVTMPMPEVYQARPWVKEVMVTAEPNANVGTQPTGPVIAETL
ncbi:MAG: anti-sigma factor [Cyanobacteria bacterium J06632_22]